MYKYRAKVVKVVDGDTVDLMIDLGFYTFTKIRGRLADVDTPERGHRDWGYATRACATLLEQNADEDGYLRVTTTKTGKYGRWIVDIKGVNSVLADTWPYKKRSIK